jgi:hypothetical protein
MPAQPTPRENRPLCRTGALVSGAAAAPRNSLDTHAGFVLLHAPRAIGGSVVYPFRETRVLVGRDPACDIELLDGAVSRQHAAISYGQGTWTLRDVGSRHGTFIDGARVEQAELQPSALVRIGDCFFKFVRAGVDSYSHYSLDGELRGRPFGEDEGDAPLGGLVGGYRMHRIARALRRLGPSRVSVVLVGEPGPERERCARALHTWSARPGRLVRVDGVGLDASTLREIIHHVVEDAHEGTLFLDGIDGLAPEEIARTESLITEVIHGASDGGPYRSLALCSIDVRLVLGVRRAPLPDLAEAPRYVVSIPPLRERKEDIRALCHATLQRLGRAEVEMDFNFLSGLLHHSFPGDVGELEQILDGARARCEGSTLLAAHLPLPLRERMALLYSSRGSGC